MAFQMQQYLDWYTHSQKSMGNWAIEKDNKIGSISIPYHNSDIKLWHCDTLHYTGQDIMVDSLLHIKSYLHVDVTVRGNWKANT